MNLKDAVTSFKEKHGPLPLRLRRSSASENLDNLFQQKYNIQEYSIHRRTEIDYIYKFIKYYKYKKCLLYLLNKKCHIYSHEFSLEYLDKYLLPDIVIFPELPTNNIIKYSLGLRNCKDKNEINLLYSQYSLDLICMAVDVLAPENTEEGLWYRYNSDNGVSRIINLNYLFNLINI